MSSALWPASAWRPARAPVPRRCHEQVPDPQRMAGDLGSGAKVVILEAGNPQQWVAGFWKRPDGVRLHVVHPNEMKWIRASGGDGEVHAHACLARADAWEER